MRIRARHYVTGDRLDLILEGGRIQSVSLASETAPDLQAEWMAPAFFDLQINGCHGVDFSSANLTIPAIRRVVEACGRHGIVELLPTVITNSRAVLVQCLGTLRAARESDAALARAIVGTHLEGPYISPEDGPRGAHPRQHVRPPDWEEFLRFQDAAGGSIRLVTLAPEHDGALTFIEKLTAAGVVVAVGHTAAAGPRIRDAIRAGARLSTHLGNGAHAVLPRHPNYIWDQLADDDLWASIICDGHHLPASVIRCILRVKTPARTILTCDASNLAGLPPGRYATWDQEFEVVPEGKIVVPDTPYLAGSWSFTDQCVGKVSRLGECSLSDCLDMAGARPRALLGLPPRSLEPGQSADLILFDWTPGGEWRLRKTIAAGRLIEN